MATDSEGKLYVGTNAGNYDGLILKLDTSGNILWSKQFGVTAPSEDIVDPSLYDASAMDNFQTVSVDKNRDVYVAGGSLGAMGDNYSGGSGYNVYMAKLDSSGNTIWMEQLGLNPPGEDIVSSSIYDSSKLDICLGIKVDDSGNVYCAGETTGSLGDNYADNPSNFTQSDIFILKLK